MLVKGGPGCEGSGWKREARGEEREREGKEWILSQLKEGRHLWPPPPDLLSQHITLPFLPPLPRPLTPNPATSCKASPALSTLTPSSPLPSHETNKRAADNEGAPSFRVRTPCPLRASPVRSALLLAGVRHPRATPEERGWVGAAQWRGRAAGWRLLASREIAFSRDLGWPPSGDVARGEREGQGSTPGPSSENQVSEFGGQIPLLGSLSPSPRTRLRELGEGRGTMRVGGGRLRCWRRFRRLPVQGSRGGVGRST